MPDQKSPIVYRYVGDARSQQHLSTPDGGIPRRSLRQEDMDALTADQRRAVEANAGLEHGAIYRKVESGGSARSAAEPKADSKSTKGGSD